MQPPIHSEQLPLKNELQWKGDTPKRCVHNSYMCTDPRSVVFKVTSLVLEPFGKSADPNLNGRVTQACCKYWKQVMNDGSGERCQVVMWLVAYNRCLLALALFSQVNRMRWFELGHQCRSTGSAPGVDAHGNGG